MSRSFRDLQDLQVTCVIEEMDQSIDKLLKLQQERDHEFNSTTRPRSLFSFVTFPDLIRGTRGNAKKQMLFTPGFFVLRVKFPFMILQLELSPPQTPHLSSCRSEAICPSQPTCCRRREEARTQGEEARRQDRTQGEVIGGRKHNFVQEVFTGQNRRQTAEQQTTLTLCFMLTLV